MKTICSGLAITTVLLQGMTVFTGAHADETIVCPGSITVHEIVKEQPEGWISVAEQAPHPLINIGFFHGNPTEKAELAPDKEVRNKEKLYSTWRFDPVTAKNLWISCSYGRTAMTLVQPAGKAYKSCTAISDLSITTEGMPTLQSMECK